MRIRVLYQWFKTQSEHPIQFPTVHKSPTSQRIIEIRQLYQWPNLHFEVCAEGSREGERSDWPKIRDERIERVRAWPNHAGYSMKNHLIQTVARSPTTRFCAGEMGPRSPRLHRRKILLVPIS
jgi:hypothetical protein